MTAAPVQPRVVARYAGVQIEDAREHIRISFATKPPRGLAGKLSSAGWSRDGGTGPFIKRSTPTAIFEAQGLLRQFCGEETQ